MTNAPMSLTRRPRSSREFDRVDKAQATLHIITVLVVIGIVFFEEAIRDVSLGSRFLVPVPQANLGQDTYPQKTNPYSVFKDKATQYTAKERSAFTQHSGERPDKMQATTTTNSTFIVGDSAEPPVNQQRNQSSAQARVNITVSGQSVNTPSLSSTVAEKKFSDSEDLNIRSVPFEKPGAEPESIAQGNWINIDDFRKRAEERAMYDALQKRAAIMSGQREGDVNIDLEPPQHNREKNVTENETIIPDASDNESDIISEYRGVRLTQENAELFRKDNLTHLSFMVYRLIRTHNLSSILDVPCTKSMIWMPEVLVRLEYEVPNFHYRCIVPNDEYLVEAILRYKGLTSAVVLKDPTFWASKLPKTDIALTWYGVGYLAPRQAWQLLKAIRQSETVYVIIPNHPDMSSNPGSTTMHGRVNVRRSPYRFDEPFRVVNNVSSTFPRKQLLMYEVERLRSGIL